MILRHFKGVGSGSMACELDKFVGCSFVVRESESSIVGDDEGRSRDLESTGFGPSGSERVSCRVREVDMRIESIMCHKQQSEMIEM